MMRLRAIFPFVRRSDLLAESRRLSGKPHP